MNEAAANAIRELALAELKQRRRMTSMKTAAEQDLLAFTRMVWPILEPERKLIEGWLLELICDVLMAITDGHMTRVCFNLPPGSTKSTMLNVIWPAWEWGPANRPGTRYLSISYSTDVPIRDNLRFAQLLKHPVYQQCWGDRVTLTRDGAEWVGNDRTGWKAVTSTTGSTTGLRGDRLLCFPAEELVRTEIGMRSIGHLVAERYCGRVWSVDVSTGALSLRHVNGWHANGPSVLVRVVLSDGTTLRCTPDHRLWTVNRGWVAAAELEASDVLPRFALPDQCDGLVIDAIAAREGTGGVRRGNDGSDLIGGEFGSEDAFAAPAVVWPSDGHRLPPSSHSDLIDRTSTDAIAIGEDAGGFGRCGDFPGLLPSEFRSWPALHHREGSVHLGVFDVCGPRAIGEVIQSVVGWVAVQMADFHVVGRRPDEGQQHLAMHEEALDLAHDADVEARVAVGRWRLEDAVTQPVRRSLAGDGPAMASDAPEVGDAVGPFQSGYRSPVLVCFDAHVDETFCLTVEGNHTFFCGDGDSILVANCDDLNNPMNVESDSVRENTSRFVREIMPDRLNDLRKSAIINLQQRTHEGDATGILIEHGQGYQFICVPMEFDPLRIGRVVLRRDENDNPIDEWVDPRSLDENGYELLGLTTNERGEPAVVPGSPMAQAEGALCWPERFDPEEIEKIKRTKGPYAWNSQYQQIPGVRGGAIIRREWWKLWAGAYPPLGTIIVSLDTAYEQGQKNDWNAVTAWGAFEGDAGEPQLLLLGAWRVREPLAKLVELLAQTCRERHADYLLIEHKSRGRDVHDEIIRLYGSSSWQTVLVKPLGGDKVQRLAAVSHLFSGDVKRVPDGTTDDQGRPVYMEHWTGGMIFAPDRDWADEVIAEVASFPYGEHDDYVDTVSQALGWVRRNGVVLRKVEYDAQEEERNRYKRPSGVPYAIRG